MTDFERLRLGMVDGQIRVADVTDHRILSAFLAVPREAFVPETWRSLAYLDSRVPLGPAGRAMLDPMTLARLVQLSAPAEQDRVLVIGCGLGYAAAVFAALTAHVVGLEVEPALAAEARKRCSALENVQIVEGALPDGAPDFAPYDLIFVDGTVATGFAPLARQLTPDGRLVAIAGESRATKAAVFRPNGETLTPTTFFDASAPTLPGFARVAAFSF